MESVRNAVINLANRRFGEYKINGDEIQPEFCPLCHGGEHQDRYTFSVNINSGAWNCKRGNCAEGRDGGSFNELARLLGENDAKIITGRILKNLGASKRKYVKPNPELIKPLTDQIIAFFEKRSIHESTLRDFKIGSDENGNIVFPFYRNNVLTFVKYRYPRSFPEVKKEYENKLKTLPPEKKRELRPPMKEWRMKDTEPILFNMDNVSYNKPLIITEGQCDAMALYEAGCTNVVSVPSGAEDLEWINTCWDWLNSFKWFILFGDSDEPGLKMITSIKDRLGQDKCMIPSEYPQFIKDGHDYGRICKDANEILYCYGPETLKEIVDACEADPVDGVLDLGRMPKIDPLKIPRIMTKIPGLDKKIGGLAEGGLTVISGRRGNGKSTLIGPIALNAIEQGYKCCIYSGELTWYKVRNDMWLQATESKYIGYAIDQRSNKPICQISDDIEDRINKWAEGKLFLFDNGFTPNKDKVETVLKVFEACIRRYGCKLFIVDNLMMLVSSAKDKFQAQGETIAKLKDFARDYKVHVIVVAHPRKEQEGAAVTNDSVSGSSEITDAADNVIFIQRPNIEIVKNRDFGELGKIVCTFNPCNRRIYESEYGDRTVYSWNHEGITYPENPALELQEFQPRKTATENRNSRPF